MKASLGLVSSLMILGAAHAEPTSSASVDPTPGTHTVSGVVVEGPRLPTKECSARDQTCINLVVAELKQHYPKQLKRFCFQREWRDIANGIPLFSVDHAGGPALKIACSHDGSAVKAP
jgi:hypothetical protein